jgi:hypothetical protein
MAKANRNSTSMSASIREMIQLHPRAKSKEIVRLLAKKGIKVRPTLVYYIRSTDRKRKRRGRRQAAAENGRKTGTGNPVQLVLKVKGLAQEAGGINNLKKLVDLLAE